MIFKEMIKINTIIYSNTIINRSYS